MSKYKYTKPINIGYKTLLKSDKELKATKSRSDFVVILIKLGFWLSFLIPSIIINLYYYDKIQGSMLAKFIELITPLIVVLFFIDVVRWFIQDGKVNEAFKESYGKDFYFL